MSRFAALTTLDRFKKICAEKLGIGTEEFEIYELVEKFEKDLSKVRFDLENWCIGNADPSYKEYPMDHKGFNRYPCGFQILENGLPVLFVNAGGDWECPICFCVYWDGKRLRAYIPSDGNMYNKKQKCAYGSEEEEPGPYTEGNYPKGNPTLIKNDVMNRIQLR